MKNYHLIHSSQNPPPLSPTFSHHSPPFPTIRFYFAIRWRNSPHVGFIYHSSCFDIPRGKPPLILRYLFLGRTLFLNAQQLPQTQLFLNRLFYFRKFKNFSSFLRKQFSRLSISANNLSLFSFSILSFSFFILSAFSFSQFLYSANFFLYRFILSLK